MGKTIGAGWSDRLFQTFTGILLILVGLVCFFPFYYIVVVSFATPAEFRQGGSLLFPGNGRCSRTSTFYPPRRS
ncbi:hypothetical protein LJK88_46370 [Paenibacillus sp. P26]|nr:hypothetical protein LJK88_46370 [Paenibacillus sp. P26]UUZ91982.1 hypothetical protein LJK87_41965 [Paenibacillus sp. P25]